MMDLEVDAHVDGLWRTGELRMRRTYLIPPPDSQWARLSDTDLLADIAFLDLGHWEGFVTYSMGAAQNYVAWLPGTRLRPATWHFPDHPLPRQD